MKFFFPDSLDLADPTFDFLSEEHDPYRVRQHDIYAHEALTVAPHYGLLVVSKTIIRQAFSEGPSTVTSLLRRLRAAGQSCEQARFHGLFAEIRSEAI